MPTYKIWHGECESHAEAEIVVAETPMAAMKNTVFRYYAGDCDCGATKIEGARKSGHLIATREGSPDYFFIEKQDDEEAK